MEMSKVTKHLKDVLNTINRFGDTVIIGSIDFINIGGIRYRINHPVDCWNINEADTGQKLCVNQCLNSIGFVLALKPDLTFAYECYVCHTFTVFNLGKGAGV